jgi:hypothetical protein
MKRCTNHPCCILSVGRRSVESLDVRFHGVVLTRALLHAFGVGRNYGLPRVADILTHGQRKLDGHMMVGGIMQRGDVARCLKPGMNSCFICW